MQEKNSFVSTTRLQRRLKTARFPARSSEKIELDCRTKTAIKYGFTFLQPFQTPEGIGFAIGIANGFVWFWIVKDEGVSY